jgi:hypothetical protein
MCWGCVCEYVSLRELSPARGRTLCAACSGARNSALIGRGQTQIVSANENYKLFSNILQILFLSIFKIKDFRWSSTF